MSDFTTQQVRAQLTAMGLSPVDDADLEEITHRINAIHEALAALELPDLDAQEELTVFGHEEARS